MGFRFRKRIRLGKGIWISLLKKGWLTFGRRARRYDERIKERCSGHLQRARDRDQLSDEGSVGGCTTVRRLATVDHQGANGIDGIIYKNNNMSDNSASNKWNDLFCHRLHGLHR
jgi:hypothetical protein